MFKNFWDTPRRQSTHQSIQGKLSKLEQFTENFVDVGESVVPNLYEELLARLEPHGVRRTLISEDNTAYDVLPGVDPVPGNKRQREEPTVASVEDKREPFYYLCVPCELRLTVVSDHSATEQMLHDVHYHVSSADHRRFAAILGDEAIDATLQRSSLLPNTKDYARIYLNGVPMLVSLRPGGGDLFHHLHGYPGHPAARHAFVNTNLAVADEPPEDPRTEIQQAVLFPRNNAAFYWYNPIQSVFTWCRQMSFIQKQRRVLAIAVDSARHVPLAFYMAHSPSFDDNAALFPVILPLNRGRIADVERDEKRAAETRAPSGKDAPASTKERGTRIVYVQSKQPICHLPVSAVSSPDVLTHGVHRCVVYHEHVYRVVLVSKNRIQELGLAIHNEEKGNVAPLLTVQLLKARGFVGSKADSLSDAISEDSAQSFTVSS